MANPVNAFLQGFRAVDQLETNRQNRQIRADNATFAKEEQSQLRKQWGRQDTEYDRQIMLRRQEDNLSRFQATLHDVMNDESLDADFLGDENKVYGEVIKNMIAKYPEFGEHMALAGGHDPGAGLLVSNKERPVSGALVVTSDKDPAGRGGVAFELNSVNGKQPMTDNRTANSNDPVTLTQYGMTELVELFGPEVMTNKYQVAKLIRSSAGITPTGNPTESQDQRQRNPTPEPEAVEAPSTGGVTSTEAAEIAIENSRRRQEVAGNAPAPVERQDTEAPFDRNQHARELSAEMRNSDAPGSSRVASGIRLAYSNTVGSFGEAVVDTATGAARFGGGGVGGAFEGTREGIDAGAGFLADVAYEVATGEAPETQGQGIDAKGGIPPGTNIYNFFDKMFGVGGPEKRLERAATPVTKPVTTVADVNKVTDGSASEYGRGNFTQPNNNAAKTVLSTPAPGNAEVARASANTVLSTKGKPDMRDMFNAVSLSRMPNSGVTAEQLRNYAKTGQFDEAAKRKLQVVQGGGGSFAVLDVTGDSAGQGRPVSSGQIGPGDGASTKQTVAERNAIRKLTVDTVEGNFADQDGKINKRHLQSFMDVQDGVFNLAGIGPNDAQRTTPSYLRSIAAGSGFVSRFNEDDIQLIDLSYGDVQIPHTAGNVAIGQVADEVGITSQDEATYFLRDYAHTLREGIEVRNDAWLVNKVRHSEAFVQDARTNPENPDYKTYKGMSQRDARTEFVKRTVAGK